MEEDIDYPSNIWNCKPDKQGCMFGCSLVNKYGGVWIDSNVIMRKPIYFMLDKEWFGYCKPNEAKPELLLFATYKKNYTINKIHKLLFKIFTLKEQDRLKILKEEYLIDDKNLYPQKLVGYLMENDKNVYNLINNNSLNQWKTIYTLLTTLKNSGLIEYKFEICKVLYEKEGKIPQYIIDQPLIKLQGASCQKEYKVNINSWWYYLTNVF